jgi:hypothetical protein
MPPGIQHTLAGEISFTDSRNLCACDPDGANPVQPESGSITRPFWTTRSYRSGATRPPQEAGQCRYRSEHGPYVIR